MSEEMEMMYKKALGYLNELRKIESLIDMIQRDYEHTLALALPKSSGCGSSFTSGNHGNSSRVEETAIRLEHLSSNKESLIKKYAKHKACVYKVLNAMQTPEYIKFLLLYYGKGMSVNDVSDELHYSRTWVYKIKKRAVMEFAGNMAVLESDSCMDIP